MKQRCRHCGHYPTCWTVCAVCKWKGLITPPGQAKKVTRTEGFGTTKGVYGNTVQGAWRRSFSGAWKRS